MAKMANEEAENYIKENSWKRKVDEIIIHSTATPEGREHDVEDIRGWHKARRYIDIGYHFLIKIDGTIEVGRNLDKTGAHVRGKNTGTIGIVYVGGTDENLNPKDTRTQEQKTSMKKLINWLWEKFGHLKVSGHNDYVNTACPSFKVNEEEFVEEENEKFESLSEKILYEWAEPKNLLNPNNYQAQAMKVMEEMGETFGAMLKGKREEEIDGFGDVFVTLIILAKQRGINPVEALSLAWEEIKNRTGELKDGVFVKD